MKTRLFLSFISIFIFVIAISAQNSASISGIVSDLRTPLKGAKVILTAANNQAQTTETDENGHYTFENVEKGKYNISVLRHDNTIFISKNITIEKNQSLTIDLTFGIQSPTMAIKVGEVFVVATGTAQPFDEVSKTVDVIENQQIQDRNEFSLTDALKTVPGFRVQQLGGFGRTANIKTRGLRNQDTAVLIDGVRFRDASSITGDASAFVSDFTFTDTNRVEVLRGSGSSLYGTNAIGGVINLETARPTTDFHGGFLGEAGNLGFGRFRGNISDGNEKIGFNAGVSRTVYTKGIDGEDNAHNTNAQGRVDFNPFSKTNISARFYISDAYVRLNSSPDTIGNLPAITNIINAVPLSRAELERFENGASSLNFGSANFIPDPNDPDNFQKSKFYNGQLFLNQIITDNLIFQGSYQALKTSRSNTDGVLGIGFQPFVGDETSVFEGQIHTFNGHFNYSPVSNNQLTVGYEHEWEKFGNDGFSTNVATNFSIRARQTSNSFYAQDLLSFFSRRLQIAAGFRTQFFRFETPKFSSKFAPYQTVALENPPNAYTGDGSISYFFEKSKTKLRAHVGNGYRVPSLYERFGTYYDTFSTPNAFVGLGDPRLKPERSISYDGGIDQTIFDNRVKLSATYFYTQLQRTIDYSNSLNNDLFGRFFGYVNSKGAISRGAEFSGQIRATGSTDVFASYTFTNSDQRASQVAGSGIIRTLGVPINQFTIVATQRFKRLTLNFDFLATSDYLAPIFSNTIFATRIYRFRGNRKADLTGSYEIPTNQDKLRFRVFGTIENLFDYEYYENGFRTAGRTGRAGVSVVF